MNAYKCQNIPFFNEPAYFRDSMEKCVFLSLIDENSTLSRTKTHRPPRPQLPTLCVGPAVQA